MSEHQYGVDAFSRQSFGGNLAAVLLLPAQGGLLI